MTKRSKTKLKLREIEEKEIEDKVKQSVKRIKKIEVADIIDFINKEIDQYEKLYYKEIESKSANALLIRERLIELGNILYFIKKVITKEDYNDSYRWSSMK